MRFAGAVLLVAAGAATALATVLLHPLWWGLALSIAATLATLWALPRGWLTRLPFALGWVALVAWMSPQRDEGDFVISSDSAGYALLGFSLVVLVVAVATLPRPRWVRSGADAEAS
jgi:hypothetical protein